MRPDILPVESNLRYLIDGESIAPSEAIAKEGFSECHRAHMHFYECDTDGVVLGGDSVRIGSGVGVVFPSKRCIDDGIVSYRSANNEIRTEYIDGRLGPKYTRFICRVRRDTLLNRTLLRGKANPIWRDGPTGASRIHRDAAVSSPGSVITSTNPDHVDTPVLTAIAELAALQGLSPFSDTDEELPVTAEKAVSHNFPDEFETENVPTGAVGGVKGESDHESGHGPPTTEPLIRRDEVCRWASKYGPNRPR